MTYTMAYLFLVTYALAGAFLVKVMRLIAKVESESATTNPRRRKTAMEVLRVNKAVFFFLWPAIACLFLFD